ncbi:MAG: hypothetical protein AB7S70_04450 [Hyphomicrobium sp.]|uniref:hypothetical protein n=1 Tax=Hyphomicrobium sp. TaxID=82 RepID=UPI003D112420
MNPIASWKGIAGLVATLARSPFSAPAALASSVSAGDAFRILLAAITCTLLEGGVYARWLMFKSWNSRTPESDWSVWDAVLGMAGDRLQVLVSFLAFMLLGFLVFRRRGAVARTALDYARMTAMLLLIIHSVTLVSAAIFDLALVERVTTYERSQPGDEDYAYATEAVIRGTCQEPPEGVSGTGKCVSALSVYMKIYFALLAASVLLIMENYRAFWQLTVGQVARGYAVLVAVTAFLVVGFYALVITVRCQDPLRPPICKYVPRL